VNAFRVTRYTGVGDHDYVATGETEFLDAESVIKHLTTFFGVTQTQVLIAMLQVQDHVAWLTDVDGFEVEVI